MFNKRLKAALRHAAIVIAASVGIASSASAAVYTGNWDPGYGGPFASLGWKASALFDIPDACLGQGDGTYAISGSCTGFTLLSAELDFYNYSLDPNPDTSPVLESFSLTAGVLIDSISITGGQLSGIDTDYFAPMVPGGASMSIAGGGAYAFRLILSDAEAQLAYTPILASPLCLSRPKAGQNCGFSETAPVGVFAPIPEPETYALMLAGLAAVGFVARRRKSR